MSALSFIYKERAVAYLAYDNTPTPSSNYDNGELSAGVPFVIKRHHSHADLTFVWRPTLVTELAVGAPSTPACIIIGYI